ncbi:zinc-containing alcohol dehydrogenase family protein [Pleurotus pulmonarius]
MKAARYYGPGDIRIEDIPEPQAKPGQIKIKIAWNGICGTDLHAYLQPLATAPTFTKPDYLSGETLPVTLGHELSGTIVDIGEGVDSKFAIGQNVCVEPIMSCMSQENCRACRNGSRNICPHLSFIGISGFGGGLAEYICADALVVHILPDGIPLEIGATIEPLAVAYHAVKRSGYKKGDTALISGAGPIGLFLLKVLRSIDTTSTIIVSEPAAIRRQFALKHGATIAHNPLEKDIVSVVLEATGGDGVEKAFDAAGIQPSIDACLAKIDPMIILLKELFLTGIICYDGEHPELLKEVAAGKFPNIEDLITRKIALKDLVEQGMEVLVKEKDTQVKILVHP